MRWSDSQLLLFTLCCTGVVLAAMAWLRRDPQSVTLRGSGWLLLAGGVGGLSLVALATLTGRLGPEHLWFGEPSFYLAVVVLCGTALWWLRQPRPRALRFGLPGALVTLAAAAVLLGRIDGRSTPVALLMPTMSQPAPELVYKDLSGARHRLADLKGQVVLVNFWATWCTPCRREMPLLSRMQRQHGPDGLAVLYVSLEEDAVLQSFLATNRFDGIQGRLERASDFYDAGKVYPLSYLISRDGRVMQRWSGRPREEWLVARIGDLL